MFFVFGRFVRKNIKAYSVRLSRLKAHDAVKVLFDYKKTKADKMLIAAAVGVCCRSFSFVYFLVMEIFSFTLSAIINNCVIACRISLVIFSVMTVLFIVLTIYVNTLIKSGWAIRRQQEAENRIRQKGKYDFYMADARTESTTENNEKIDEDEKMREIIKNQLESYRKESEQDFITETFDRSHRKRHHH